MAERRRATRGKPRPRRKSAPRRSATRPLLRSALLAAMVLGSLAAVALAGYLYHLDRTITRTFEGRRWSVPAVIYAQPLELFPGAALSLGAVTRELDRLGYEARANLALPGTYKRTADRLEVYLRAFRFMDRQRTSQRIAIDFDDGVIADVRDPTGRPVLLVRMDPLTIGSFFPTHGEDRLVLTPEQIPELLRQALKAVEDQNFDEHLGFDPNGILRALWVNLRAGEIQQGGSTLTQQLVKSYYLDNRRTVERKLRELAMSVILDARFDKAEILDAYINEIYLGQDGQRAIHGFGLGAQYYFNRPLEELSVDQIATLIAVIRGPSYYNPFRHPQRALDRRNLVLDKMQLAGLIDVDQHTQSLERPLQVAQGARSGGAYHPAFMDLVRRELAERYRDEDLTQGGLRIFTTLQPDVQDAVDRALSDTLTQLENDRQMTPDTLQGAAVVTAIQTGEVLAVAGGRSAGFDGFNRALEARRPVGSLIKPVVYLTALEQGYHLASPVADEPVRFEQSGRVWTPRNFDGEVYGEVPLVRALGDSLNLATVHLGLELGIDRIAARLAGLTGTAPQNPYPSLLLGAEPMTPVDVATLYGTFASGGFHTRPKAVISVLDEQAEPLSRHSLELDQRIDPGVARVLSRGLMAVMEHGTGRGSRFARAGTAGKTGTSDDYRDSWFAGYDDVHVGVVWVGADDNRPTGLTGSSGALRVWDDIMAHLGVMPLPPAAGADLQTIDYRNGLAADPGCPDAVAVPLPQDVILRREGGCGINSPTISDRIRAWLGTDQ